MKSIGFFDKATFPEVFRLFLAGSFLACLPLIGTGENDSRKFLLLGIWLIMASAIGAYAFKKLLIKKEKEKKSNQLTFIDWSVIVFLLSCLISTAGSIFPRNSLVGTIKYALYIICYFCFSSAFFRETKEENLININNFLKCSLLGLFWVCLEGIIQIICGVEPLATWQDPSIANEFKMNRIYSTLLNPNLLAAYLLLFWNIPLYFAFKAFRKKNLFVSFLYSVFSLVIIYLIIQTGSRGAWIALVGQFCFLCTIALIYFRSPKLIALISGLSGTIFIYVLSKKAILNRIFTIFSSHNDSSNSYRMNVWDACLRIFYDNPFFGTGAGSETFFLVYGAYMHPNYHALGAYSIFLETAVELGTLGLFSLFLLILGCSYISYKTFTQAKELNEKILVLAISASLFGAVLSGLFDIVILRPQVQIFIWMFIAILNSLGKERVELSHREGT